MKDLFTLLKSGNKPSLLAGFVNLILGIIKGIAFFFTGNVAMFAEMMHSLGDSANQFFVFIGSALSKKAPTPKYPTGFGRVVNLVCLGAVLIVGILAYETIKEGISHIMHPSESTGMWITISVLALGIVLEGMVLLKAAQEIAHETGIKVTAFNSIPLAFKNLSKAKPATKLVFMEDAVATSGGIIAIISVLLSHYFGLTAAEGIASIVIGMMMFYVVTSVFLENARGVIGETDEEMLNHIAYLVSDDPNIHDIKRLEVIKEGEFLHVEMMAEIDPSLELTEVHGIRENLMNILLSQKRVSRVTISFDGDDGITNWNHIGERPESLKTTDA